MTPILSSTILRTQSDARLAALAREGHERAFEAIVERYRRPLLRFCRRFLPEPRAEDAVQQAFLGAWSSLRAGTEVGDLRTWLYRIARNAALDALKRSGYDYAELTEALSLSPAPEGEVERRWVVRETLTGVAALPENQREALLRTVVEGQSRAQIARELQISEGAVRQLVHRARASLRSAATAITPGPLVTWAAELGTAEAPMVSRVGELVAGAGAVGGASILKAGTAVVAAGALAVGMGTEVREPSRAADAVAAPSRQEEGDERRGSRSVATGARSGSGRARGARESDARTRATVDDRGSGSLNSGPGSVNSGPGSVNSGSGSSGSGSSGSGSSGSDSSGSGSSGSSDFDGSSGSGSSGSGSGSSGSGSSGSGSSGSGSGSSGSGSSGSGSSGSGSGDDDSSGSGSGGDDGDSSGSGSGDDGDNSGSGSGDDDSSGSGDGDDDD